MSVRVTCEDDDPRDGTGQKKPGSAAVAIVLVGVLALLGGAAAGAVLCVALRGDDHMAVKNVPLPPDPTPVVSRNSVYQYVLTSAAWIVTRRAERPAMSSGVLIDRDNRLVLTNYHVVHDVQDLSVFFPMYRDGNQLVSERSAYQQANSPAALKGRVIAEDSRRDLALIQLDGVPEGVEALPFAAREPAVGDRLHAVGNPGESGALWVYTPGEVRAVYNKRWKAPCETGVLDLDARVLEATSPTNLGDSGGPCVNDNGELVGVTQGAAAGGNLLSLFIEHSMAEDLIKRAFAESPALKDRQWVRAKRPPIK